MPDEIMETLPLYMFRCWATRSLAASIVVPLSISVAFIYAPSLCSKVPHYGCALRSYPEPVRITDSVISRILLFFYRRVGYRGV
jgi:hypothetical protein